MKILFIFSFIMALTFSVFAQAPPKMSYQAVIRNTDGGLVSSHAIGMRISILQGSQSGTAVYVETHTTTTNTNGLATIEIGGGTVVSGSFTGINWGSASFFLKTETDPAGGSAYSIVGTSQLLSVPYALNSKKSESVADNSVTSPNIVDGSIVTSDLADHTVSTAKLGNLAVSADKIQSGAVVTDKLANGSVTGAKIAQAGATSGQALKWNGTIWAPAADATGGGITLPYSGSGSSEDAIFHVTNTHSGSTSAYGLQGTTTSTNGSGIACFATSTSGQSRGVYGYSSSVSGSGVYGRVSQGTGQNYGIHGECGSDAGAGIKGRAYNNTGANYGVFGESESESGYGVYGKSPKYGVFGESASEGGYGVYGKAASATGTNYGVYGETASPDGYAGYFKGRFYEKGSTTGNTDLFYVTNTGTGRAIHAVAASNTAVWGASTSGYAGVDGRNTSGIGVSGQSDTNYGVYGKSNENYGVYGTSDLTGGRFDGILKGVHGLATGTSGINYGVYGKTNSSSGYAGYFEGNVKVTGTLSKGGGSFEIDHPLDPANKILRHSFVESPDMMNVYNGNIMTDANGIAEVILPDYFEALNSDFRYQLTVIGEFAQAIISDEIRDNRFTISTDKPNVKVSWQVTGIRKDPWAAENRIVVEEEKNQTLPVS